MSVHDIPDEVRELMDGVPRRPEMDPTLGIPVDLPPLDAPPDHRLVAVGDSLTHGFRSGAIWDTENAYPVLIAKALGIEDSFRYSHYAHEEPASCGGIPLNIEWLLRGLGAAAGGRHGIAGAAALTIGAVRLLEQHEHYWESAPGNTYDTSADIDHNLAVYGWDLRDAFTITADQLIGELAATHDRPLDPMPVGASELGPLRVLGSARAGGRSLTQLDAAVELGKQGVETLIVFLGANNALQSVVKLDVAWSEHDAYRDPDKKNRYTVWRPSHFAGELAEVVARIDRVRARHVLWLTIPHVTIAPIAKGIGAFMSDTSPYFTHYVRPWVTDETPHLLPHIAGEDAKAVDYAIDAYNTAIVGHVAAARRASKDWAVVDISGVLDRLAYRRYLTRPQALPPWWWDADIGGAYQIDPELPAALGFTPDSRFLQYADGRVAQGGLVGLDGVHPTCSGYSIIAAECLRAMARLGVEIPEPRIDYDAVVRADTLCTRPFAALDGTMEVLKDLDAHFDVLGLFERALRLVKG